MSDVLSTQLSGDTEGTAESWPPAPAGGLIERHIDRVTVRQDPEAVEITWHNPRRGALVSCTVLFVIAIVSMVWEVVSQSMPLSSLPNIGGLLSASPGVWTGMVLGIVLFAICAFGELRSIRVIERTRILVGRRAFVDGVGRIRGLDEIDRITVIRIGAGLRIVYQIRMWPDIRGVVTFLKAYHACPVWNVATEAEARELEGIVAGAAGLATES